MATNNTSKTEFKLPANAYATFDATSLKSLIIDRLNRTNTLTDQNFEGSNMSAVIDIIAYSYHVLLYYLNQTSSETLFTDAELYENMNRIVKSIDYKPVGYQTSTLSFGAVANQSLGVDTYTIPRYAFVNAGGVTFSLKQDITFSKTQTQNEALDAISNHHLLYQGKFEEYPLLTATGEEFELITLLPGDDLIVDHFNIDVYVKDYATGTWTEWQRTPSLFLEGGSGLRYEVRLNENKRYEIKFGNNVNGKKLTAGDTIAVYYIKSDGKAGEIGPNSVNGAVVTPYNTVQFTGIFNQVKTTNTNYMNDTQLGGLSFTNANASTEYSLGETVEQIRQRAPKTYASQHRLVTKTDYENFIRHTFSNVIGDVKVVNNWDYMDGHMKYTIDTLKLKSHNTDPNTLYNQVNFADACDFNNVYIYGVPRADKSASTVVRNNYLTPAQKGSIIDSVRDNKTLTSETIIIDPVYIAADVGLLGTGETLSTTISDSTRIRLMRTDKSRVSLDSIRKQAHSIVTNFFNNVLLGSLVDITQLNNDLLNIRGVESIKTVRTDLDVEVNGISMVLWNPVYPSQDISVISGNIQLPYFKYPYLNDSINFITKIEAVATTASAKLSEF